MFSSGNLCFEEEGPYHNLYCHIYNNRPPNLLFAKNAIGHTLIGE
jgi:hypothetical protein